MAAASSVVELCTLANAKLDAATSAKFFHDDGAGAISSSLSWPEVDRTPSRLTCQTALRALCEEYQVPADYIPISLDRSWVACRPPPEGSNAICVYAGALEAGMRIPLHEFYVAVLGHYSLAPSQLAPDAWRYMAPHISTTALRRTNPPSSNFAGDQPAPPDEPTHHRRHNRPAKIYTRERE